MESIMCSLVCLLLSRRGGQLIKGLVVPMAFLLLQALFPEASTQPYRPHRLAQTPIFVICSLILVEPFVLPWCNCNVHLDLRGGSEGPHIQPKIVTAWYRYQHKPPRALGLLVIQIFYIDLPISSRSYSSCSLAVLTIFLTIICGPKL